MARRWKHSNQQRFSEHIAESIEFHASVCTGKVRYSTESKAKAKVKQCKTRGLKPTKPYFCQICNGYHLKTKRVPT